MKPTIIVDDIKIAGIFANVAGRWIPWLADPNIEGVPIWRGDHPWTRAQILHDQGPEGAALWKARRDELGS